MLIEPIHNDHELEVEKFGARAEQLRKLHLLGFPVPEGLLFSVDQVAQLPKSISASLTNEAANLFGLYSMRSSPGQNHWGSVEAVLNIGMSDSYLEEIAPKIGWRNALDLYRRFICSFSTLVYGLEPEIFENLYYDQMRLLNIEDEQSLEQESLSLIVQNSKSEFQNATGFKFPQSLMKQIDMVFDAMARSWYRPSAKILRNARAVPENAGTGLILQRMVLGVGKALSGSGKCNPIDRGSGKRYLHGFFLPNSQGNDAIMGLRTPHMLSELQNSKEKQSSRSLENLNSRCFKKIKMIVEESEKKLGDLFEFEFTIENNKLFVLDAVKAERSPRASVAVAVDLALRGAISKEEAVLRVNPDNLIEFLHPQIDPNSERDVFGNGLPASPGAACGKIVFSSFAANQLSAKGEAAILVRVETTPEDIRGMHASVGVLTERGGMTSHAAVVARGLGLPCVVGAHNLTMNLLDKTVATQDGRIFREGDVVTLDGTLGQAMVGYTKMLQPKISGEFSKLMEWADQFRTMGVRANADTPQEAKLAQSFGVDGIGLCRTEHMFFEQDRLIVMREMILAKNESVRKDALRRLLPMQRDDFIKLFQIMRGSPVTIRLLDPPLHEFLPHSNDEMRLIAQSMNVPLKDIVDRSKDLEEFNPMLGKRGVRLGVTMPEIYEMQAQAIFEAAAEVNNRYDGNVIPEIMIPLVSANQEVQLVKERISSVAKKIKTASHSYIKYKLGVVVETPRAALRAGDISATSDFLSFGTNDLTQMTYGLSRDDAGRFMQDYLERVVFPHDPFHSLDIEGVGELLLLASERAVRNNTSIELGLCGEHGGDPISIRFCKRANFDYVSCSPFRVPIARLAAAQASIDCRSEKNN